MLVIEIKLKDKTIEAVFREKDPNLPRLIEMISLVGDFKQYPKKFKEIFSNYVRTEFSNALTNNKLIIIPTS